MVSYVRSVRPLFAHFVETRQDGSFAISAMILSESIKLWKNGNTQSMNVQLRTRKETIADEMDEIKLRLQFQRLQDQRRKMNQLCVPFHLLQCRHVQRGFLVVI